MGSKILASDMLISEMLIPMQNAYHHADYAKASHDLYVLSSFLLGFGEGIKDFPRPPTPKNIMVSDARTRINEPQRYLTACKNYYEEHSPTIMMCFGQYQRKMLDALEHNKFALLENTTID